MRAPSFPATLSKPTGCNPWAWWGTIGLLACLATTVAWGEDPWVTFRGGEGPGKGKQIVFVTGDEEYRSEESMPQLAKILALRHGFTCTVLFAIDPKTGLIDTTTLDNIPGLESLDHADLMVLFVRFRELPDAQMKHIIDYTNSGRPIVALRTSTHAFSYRKHPESPYAKYSYNDRVYSGGYGRQVLGETWINHWGIHQHESTRGLIALGMENHPIVRGIDGLWGPSDVYEIKSLTGDCTPVVMGQCLSGMTPSDLARTSKKLMPVAWTKTFTGTAGKPARIFTTTMGHAGDLQNEGFRRLLVNACYWALGMERETPARAGVELVGKYEPGAIGFGKHKRGVRPVDYQLR